MPLYKVNVSSALRMGIFSAETVISKESEYSPIEAVIFASPVFNASATPSEAIFTTSGLSLDHKTSPSRFSVFAVNFTTSPSSITDCLFVTIIEPFSASLSEIPEELSDILSDESPTESLDSSSKQPAAKHKTVTSKRIKIPKSFFFIFFFQSLFFIYLNGR